MKVKSVIVITLLLITTCLNAQTNFDYYPVTLQKELRKLSAGSVNLKELPLSAEISGQIDVGKFYKVSDYSTSSPVQYVYVGRVNTCRAGGCNVRNSSINENGGEFFDYFILFDSKYAIQLVKIYNYKATHGQEITSKYWLRQFKSFAGDNILKVGKDIDAISGATISVDAIIFDIENKIRLLGQVNQ
jgi:hypothetical protein